MKSNSLLELHNEDDHMKHSNMLTFDEAYVYLKVSKSFLYKATSLRTIPFYKPTGGKILRFKKEDLDNWLEGNRVSSKSEIVNEV